MKVGVLVSKSSHLSECGGRGQHISGREFYKQQPRRWAGAFVSLLSWGASFGGGEGQDWPRCSHFTEGSTDDSLGPHLPLEDRLGPGHKGWTSLLCRPHVPVTGPPGLAPSTHLPGYQLCFRRPGRSALARSCPWASDHLVCPWGVGRGRPMSAGCRPCLPRWVCGLRASARTSALLSGSLG